MHKSLDKKGGKKAPEVSLYDWRKTITVNRSRSFGLFLDKLTRDGVMVDKCVFFLLATRPPSVDFQKKKKTLSGQEEPAVLMREPSNTML